MKVSTKGRYGLRIMLDIAQNSGHGPVAIKEIAARQEISVKYTEQIMVYLVKAGMLRSVRGAQGGYELVRRPDQYTVAEILRCIEGDWAPVQCVLDASYCARREGCPTASLWSGLYDTINKYLEGVTLQSLMDEAESSGDFYSI